MSGDQAEYQADIVDSMMAWGITMTLMGLVQSAAGLQAARFFLGIAEGGLFPGIVSYGLAKLGNRLLTSRDRISCLLAGMQGSNRASELESSSVVRRLLAPSVACWRTD